MKELLALIVIGAVLAGLLIPAIQSERPPSLRNSCLNKGKQIGLAMLNYENSKKRFPLISQLRTSQSKQAARFFARPESATVNAALKAGISTNHHNTLRKHRRKA